jgi:hypothetical protein
MSHEQVKNVGQVEDFSGIKKIEST